MAELVLGGVSAQGEGDVAFELNLAQVGEDMPEGAALPLQEPPGMRKRVALAAGVGDAHQGGDALVGAGRLAAIRAERGQDELEAAPGVLGQG